MKDKINIYLDLDETLIYSYSSRSRKKILTKHTFNFENIYYIVERPGLQPFLIL